MIPTTPSAEASAPDFGVAELRASMRKIERRDLWAWGNTVVVVLCLTAIIVSLAVSMLLKGTKTVLGLNLMFAVQALVVFVPTFNLYGVYVMASRRLAAQLRGDDVGSGLLSLCVLGCNRDSGECNFPL